MLVNFGLENGFYLGVLSSKAHVHWAIAAGGRQGVGDDPRYNKTRCFDPFPFPDCSERERATITAIAEELDALRKERLRLHPNLTLTALYNVLVKLRSGAPLTAADHDIHNRGLIGVLRRLHDDLDRAVLAAYGWPSDLSDDDLLSHLVALNRERAEEEWRGNIRWLRPEFQAGIAAAPVQRELVVAAATQWGVNPGQRSCRSSSRPSAMPWRRREPPRGPSKSRPSLFARAGTASPRFSKRSSRWDKRGRLGAGCTLPNIALRKFAACRKHPTKSTQSASCLSLDKLLYR